MSLLDKIRSEPEHVATVTCGGVDPDLHQTAIARVTVETSTKVAMRIRTVKAVTVEIPAKLTGEAAVNAMAHELMATQQQTVWRCDWAYVEGQRIYPRGDIPKLIGQGNDLIHLGQVAGAALAVYAQNQVETQLVLPENWKAQAKKTGMHLSAMAQLRAHRTTVVFNTLQLDWDLDNETLISTFGIHAMDAVCLALRGISRDIK